MTVVILGVDPGRTTGIALLGVNAPHIPVLVQCGPGGVLCIVEALIARTVDQGSDVALAVERFVSGPRSGKLATPAGAAIARTTIAAVTALAQQREIPLYLRSAADVKPWATDARLDKICKDRRGMPHAADALRHALFTGVRAYGMPDPLSRRGSS